MTGQETCEAYVCCLQKLEALEKEEEMREQAWYYDSDSEEDPEMDEIRRTARK